MKSNQQQYSCIDINILIIFSTKHLVIHIDFVHYMKVSMQWERTINRANIKLISSGGWYLLFCCTFNQTPSHYNTTSAFLFYRKIYSYYCRVRESERIYYVYTHSCIIENEKQKKKMLNLHCAEEGSRIYFRAASCAMDLQS